MVKEENVVGSKVVISSVSNNVQSTLRKNVRTEVYLLPRYIAEVDAFNHLGQLVAKSALIKVD